MTWEDNRRGASTEDGFIIEEGVPTDLIPRNIHWHDNYMHSFTENGVKIANLKKAITTVSSLPEVGDTEVFYFLDTADEDHKVGIYYYDGANYVYDDAPTLVGDHNVSPTAHADIRALIQAMSTDMKYKGSVEDKEHLPTNAKKGDVYTTLDDGREYVYDGDEWVEIGFKINVVQNTGTSTEDVMSQKAVTDALESAGGKARELTEDDYDYPTSNPTGVALWKLPSGMYCGNNSNLKLYTSTRMDIPGNRAVLISNNSGDAYIFSLTTNQSGMAMKFYLTSSNGTAQSESNILLDSATINNLTSTDVDKPLSAKQGKILKGLIDDLDTPFTGTDGTTAGEQGLVPAPATTDAGKFLKADGTWDTVQAGPTVVQTIGTSTTDVMSQDAATKLIFKSYSGSHPALSIGDYTGGRPRGTSVGSGSIQIGLSNAGFGIAGYNTLVGDAISIGQYNTYSCAYGANAGTDSSHTVSIGSGSFVYNNADYSVALGAYSKASVKGEVSFGSTALGTNGYNNSQYRLLTNVYDGQTAHDACTKGQLDAAIISGGTTAPTTATVGQVGTLYIYVDSGTPKIMVCTDTTGGTYTWTDVMGSIANQLANI